MTFRRLAAALVGLIAALLMLPLLVPPVDAQRLPQTVTPEHYDLSFVVDILRQRFEGDETIHVRVPQPTRRVVLNAAELNPIPSPPPSQDPAQLRSQAQMQGYTGDQCSNCNSMRMKVSGHCMVCEDCGTTTGCS